MKKNVILFIFILINICPLMAQETGSISGIVQDDFGVLPGVNIRLKDFTIGGVTEMSGTFLIFNIPVGKQTILFSFLGYKTIEKEVFIESGKITNILNIKFESSSQQLDEVVISNSMTRPSQKRALTIQKNSLAIMNVLSADAIGKLPDRNVAEAVQRIQAVAVARYHGEADQATVRGTPFTWTSIMLNGSRLPSANAMGTRSAILDAIPSEIIQYVQVAKALTPDIEGDAIGGSINFITRTAPLKRRLDVSLARGYNDLSQNGTFNGSMVYGDRFFKDKLGLIFTTAVWDRNFGTDSYDLSYNTGLANPVQQRSINTLMLKRYMGKRQTIGSNLGLEWVFNIKNKIYARGLFDKFTDIRSVYESYIDFNKTGFQYNYRYSDYRTTLNGFDFGGEHQVTDHFKMDWNIASYQSEFNLFNTPNTVSLNNRGLPIATFRQNVLSGFGGLSSDGRKYLRHDSPEGVGDDPMNVQAHLMNPNERMNPDLLTLQQLVIAQIYNQEKDKVATLNFNQNLDNNLALKYGGKYRYKDKSGINNATLLFLPETTSLILLSNLERTTFPLGAGFFNNLNGDHNSFIIDPLTKQQLFNLYTPKFLKDNEFRDRSSPSNVTNRYDGYEVTTSLYVMTEWKIIEDLNFVGGLRNEYTAFKLNSGKYEQEEVNGVLQSKILKVSSRNDYNAFLPMLHLKYKFSDNKDIRIAYTRSFVRPNFTDLIPSENINFTTNPINITRGNPNLNPTFSNNFDIMSSYFFENVGILTGGIFYKDLKNIIFTDKSFALNESGATVLITEPKNLESANLLGMEIGINKKFDFLPSFWSGFGVDVNYTYIKSAVNVPRLVGEKTVFNTSQLPNQSKILFNTGLFYEREKIMIRVTGNYRGKSVETISQQLGPELYTWTTGNFTVDAAATISLTHKLKAFVELNNLTNEPVKTYLGDSNRPLSVEWSGVRGQLGMRYEFF